MYPDAEKCVSETENYYVKNGSAEDLCGDIFSDMWRNCSNDEYLIKQEIHTRMQ